MRNREEFSEWLAQVVERMLAIKTYTQLSKAFSYLVSPEVFPHLFIITAVIFCKCSLSSVVFY